MEKGDKRLDQRHRHCQLVFVVHGGQYSRKTSEALNYMGGLPLYQKKINACAANGYEGFVLKK